MTHLHIHQPPPDSVVEKLVKAGISHATVLSMEPWKAVEILELLKNDGFNDGYERPELHREHGAM